MSQASSPAATSPLSSTPPRAAIIPDDILLADHGKFITLDRERHYPF